MRSPLLKKAKSEIVVRALHTKQGKSQDVYAFFIRGADIVKFADITRLNRGDGEVLKGFQRPEIRSHVKGILDYLNRGQVLFPNSIIVAFSNEVHFSASRGTKPMGDEGIAQSGTLTIPIYAEGSRVAWIVDGQQRSIALAQATDRNIAVPVIGFIAESLDIQREQFILVNKAKPLPTRLINELLPETDTILLPREISTRKIPSEICDLLNRDIHSPFFQLIKRPSDGKGSPGVIIDTAVIAMIRNSINSPLGALAPYKAMGQNCANLEAMYRVITTFWSAVKNEFPAAWGIDPRRSRLMHSAGIVSMGVLMDRIYGKFGNISGDLEIIQRELRSISSSCRWTEGVWEDIGMAWNEIQNTPKDIKKLQDALVRLYSMGMPRK